MNQGHIESVSATCPECKIVIAYPGASCKRVFALMDRHRLKAHAIS